MNFLAPLFLLGGLAIAGPVVFHLIRRTIRDRTPFSSLLFLQPTPPRLTKRSRIEHWLLLALRCLALLLLALGFSRPFLQQPVLPTSDIKPTRRTVLLLDTSASMRRTGLWDDARSRIAGHIREAGPSDQVALITFDREVLTQLSFSQWEATPASGRTALALATLERLKPGWASTRIGPALIHAAGELTDTDEAASGSLRRILLISDLQEGSRLDPLQSYEWPKGIEVVPEPVRPRTLGNAGIQLVAESRDSDRGVESVLRIRVANSSDSKREQFQVGWSTPEGNEFAVPPSDLYVPPGQSRTISLATPTHAVGLNRILLRGDDEAFDNTLFVRPPQPIVLNLLYLGSDSPTNVRQPSFFLRRALPDTRRQTVQLSIRKTSEIPSPEVLAAAQLIVITDRLPEALADAVRQQMESGRTVVFAPAHPDASETLSRLVNHPTMAITEVQPTTYALLGELDFRHPALAPFADPRFSDFTRIHFWKYRKLSEPLPDNARVVARFDSGSPAWIDFPIGHGRLLFLASGWGTDDSQFALSSKFVPWLYGLLDLAGASTAPIANPVVGDPILLPTGRTADFPVHLPDGTVTNLPTDVVLFAGTHQPGLYGLGSGPGATSVAVNVDPAETRTVPLGTEELDRLGVRLDSALSTTAMDVAPKTIPPATEAESRQKLWRWLLAGTLAILLIESIIAGRTAHQNNLPQEAAL